MNKAQQLGYLIRLTITDGTTKGRRRMMRALVLDILAGR